VNLKKRRDTSSNKPALKALWNALDEVAFGAERTLNLRESLPTAAEARARTETWLRGRQAQGTGDVLIITGRGNQSVGGTGVIRQEVLAMLPSLRRKGVVESWREHSPGSIVVTPAPLSTLINAGKRRRDAELPPQQPQPIAGLERQTAELLRQLALVNLESLGIVATDVFIEQEMARTFSTLMTSVLDSPDREAAIRAAIQRALEEPGAT
jgi:hypothetical protein